MDLRSELFHILKPLCVRLSQAALGISAGRRTEKEVVDTLEQLLKVLQTNSLALNALDAKIAEYVFFPLSHVLRQKEKLPVKASELSLLCLAVLLRTGWRSHLAPALGTQLLILLTFMADGRSENASNARSSEELQIAAYTCLSALLNCLTGSIAGQKSLKDAENIPALGHSVTVMLEGAAQGKSIEIQLSALVALEPFCSKFPDRDVLAKFFPGIVSTLAKILTPIPSSRQNYRVIILSLQLLCSVLTRVISDEHTSHLLEESVVVNQDETEPDLPFGQSWLNATAAQVKLALANVVKLHKHERPEVRRALFELCLSVLEDCERSLRDSASMMVETLVTLSNVEDEEYMQKKLRQLLTTKPNAQELLKISLHGWIISLHRIIESPDDIEKKRAGGRVAMAFRLLASHDNDFSIIDQVLATSLRDSVVSALNSGHVGKDVREVGFPLDFADVSTAPLKQPQITFRPILESTKTQRDILAVLQCLTEEIAKSSSAYQVGKDLLHMAKKSRGINRLSSFWLSLSILRHSIRHSGAVEDLVDFGVSESASMQALLLDEIYSASLAILEEDVTEEKWRLQGLALEVIALQAKYQEADFRLELVDALYPVIHLVGSSVAPLRDHAIVCLNMVAASCGYKDARDLIVSNVDYLVNAIALKLNTFDISPQAPQVLLMMVKLTGPPLLSYLDDVVENVFAALESFHGYPKLVEMLFRVLRAIAEEGTKSPQLALENGRRNRHAKPPLRPTSINVICSILKKKQKDYEGHEKQSVSENFTELEEMPSDIVKSNGIDNNFTGSGEEKEVSSNSAGLPPVSRPYDLLLKITRLTEHYLPSSSPILRGALLSLVQDSIPTLAMHEDHFLPLINTLWPMITARLEDSEAHIVASSLEVIGQLCVYAGDFMRGRISAVWGELKRIYNSRGRNIRALHSSKAITSSPRANKNETRGEQMSILRPGLNADVLATNPYVDSGTRLIWDKLVSLVIQIVGHVSIDEDVFDDILEMLEPVLTERPEAKRVLEDHNPDAVWLRMLKAKQYAVTEQPASEVSVLRTRKPPALAGWEFADMPL